MVLKARYIVPLVLALLVILPSGCSLPPPGTPQPSASATAIAPPETPTPTPLPPTLPSSQTPTPPPPTATAQPSATPGVQRTAIPLPTLPTRTPDSLPPRPTVAAVAPPWPTPCPPGAAFLVSSLVVTPAEPPVYYLVAGGHLYHSADRGDTWSPEDRAGLPAGADLFSVAVDYRRPQTLYAATSQGLYRREGQGEWSLVNTLAPMALAVDLENPDILWAGIRWTSEMNAVIVKSQDAGRTWGKADEGIPSGGGVERILVDPNNPNVLWALVTPRYHGAMQLYRGGRDGHWERLDLGCQSGDCCYPSGIAYDPSAGLLFLGCSLYSPGGVTRAMLLRSANADAADSRTIRWQAVTPLSPEAAPGIESARPLAVDAREPRSLIVLATFREEVTCLRYRLLASHDDGATWQPLKLDGIPETSSGQDGTRTSHDLAEP